MVQIFQTGPSPQGRLAEQIGQSLGGGLAEFTGNYMANKQLEEILSNPEYSKKEPHEKLGILQQRLAPYGKFGQQVFENRVQAEQMEEQAKQQKRLKSQIKKQAGILAEVFNNPEIEDIEDPQIINTLFKEYSKGERQRALYNDIKNLGEESLIENESQPMNAPFAPGITKPDIVSKQSRVPSILTKEKKPPYNQKQIDAAIAINPALGARYQEENKQWFRQQQAEENRKRSEFLEERNYNIGYSKEAEKEVNNLRQTIPKKSMALDLARNAIETGKVDYFSPDKLADITGVDLFRTAKGAQLIAASKENLLNNMSRVSARAQNIWFEQRLNSIFPKIGQSKEANLTAQEMIEGELAMDKAYVDTFDRLAKQDEDEFGYVKKDINKRTQDELKPLENEIMKRTTYRMKEVEEQEKGLSRMKEEVGKKVQKGTPLTLSMAKLYKSKFGDEALKVAQQNGYYIPSLEDFENFQKRPSEFRQENIK